MGLNEMGDQMVADNRANGWTFWNSPEAWGGSVEVCVGVDFARNDTETPGERSFLELRLLLESGHVVFRSAPYPTEVANKLAGQVLDAVDTSRFRIPAALALIMSEAAEALEAFRKGDRENFGEEGADIVIRTLDLFRGLGFDVDERVLAKMAKNRGRGHRHGGKRV